MSCRKWDLVTGKELEEGGHLRDLANEWKAAAQGNAGVVAWAGKEKQTIHWGASNSSVAEQNTAYVIPPAWAGSTGTMYTPSVSGQPATVSFFEDGSGKFFNYKIL